jgi:hypothetical protein
MELFEILRGTQLSAIFGSAQVKIFMPNVYTKPRVCMQEK